MRRSLLAGSLTANGRSTHTHSPCVCCSAYHQTNNSKPGSWAEGRGPAGAYGPHSRPSCSRAYRPYAKRYVGPCSLCPPPPLGRGSTVAFWPLRVLPPRCGGALLGSPPSGRAPRPRLSPAPVRLMAPSSLSLLAVAGLFFVLGRSAPCAFPFSGRCRFSVGSPPAPPARRPPLGGSGSALPVRGLRPPPGFAGRHPRGWPVPVKPCALSF